MEQPPQIEQSKPSQRQRRRLAKTQAEIFLANLNKALESAERNFLEVGRLLSQAYHSADDGPSHALWRQLGHHNFKDFVRARTKWSIRRSYALIGAVDCIAKYEIDDVDALEAGSSKMSLIAAHSKQWELQKDEVMACLNMAKDKDVGWDEFVDWVSKRKLPEENQRFEPQRRLIRFRFNRTEREWAINILEHARSVLADANKADVNLITREHALTTILKEWATSHGIDVENIQ